MQMKEIVIKVPKDLYDKGQLLHFFGAYSSILDDAIYNGTVLPAGHGRLIDADAEDLQSELWTFTRYTGIDEAPYEDACMALDKAPTIVEADGGDAE